MNSLGHPLWIKDRRQFSTQAVETHRDRISLQTGHCFHLPLRKALQVKDRELLIHQLQLFNGLKQRIFSMSIICKPNRY